MTSESALPHSMPLFCSNLFLVLPPHPNPQILGGKAHILSFLQGFLHRRPAGYAKSRLLSRRSRPSACNPASLPRPLPGCSPPGRCTLFTADTQGPQPTRLFFWSSLCVPGLVPAVQPPSPEGELLEGRARDSARLLASPLGAGWVLGRGHRDRCQV